jgi:adenylate cyclase
MAGSIGIALFGGMLVQHGANEVIPISGNKVRALLGYLAASLGSPCPRSKVAAMLWGDRGERQARDSLKQAVWHLRRALSPTGRTPVLADRQSITLDAACVTVDAIEFEKLLSEGTPEAADRAIELYRGELLEGIEVPDAAFEEWLLMERQRLRQVATEAMAAALLRSMSACQRDRAATVARQLLILDPHHEGASRALMQIHLDRGERGQALTLFESLRRRLSRDLGIRPEPATVAVYESARRQRDPAGRPGGSPAAGEDHDGGGRQPSAEPWQANDAAAVPSIAVLPFGNIGGDPEQDYFAQGLTEDVITDLSQLSGLLTVVHHGSHDPRERPSPQEAARRLRASYVLEGSVRKLGDRVRITAQLVEGATAGCIWARRYDRDVRDIFVLQEELSKDIADALRVKLLPGEVESLADRPTTSVEAYQLYLLGRAFYLRGCDKRSLRIAYDLFAKATEIDPLYAHAQAARATCGTNLCGNDPTVTSEAILATSERAIELAPALGEAHAAKGLAHYVLGNYPEALVHLDRAMALEPSLFEAHFFKARCCRLLGQREPALILFENAAELRPHDYRCAGLLAEEYQAVGLDREFRSAAARSLQLATQEVKNHPDNADAWAFGSAILVEMGESLRGEAWASRAAIIGPDDYLVHYNVSRTYALLGKIDPALGWLERALDALPVFRQRLYAWMPLDQALDPLRGHRRFSRLLGRA